jgi:hypothetical protein
MHPLVHQASSVAGCPSRVLTPFVRSDPANVDTRLVSAPALPRAKRSRARDCANLHTAGTMRPRGQPGYGNLTTDRPTAITSVSSDGTTLAPL